MQLWEIDIIRLFVCEIVMREARMDSSCDPLKIAGSESEPAWWEERWWRIP